MSSTEGDHGSSLAHQNHGSVVNLYGKAANIANGGPLNIETQNNYFCQSPGPSKQEKLEHEVEVDSAVKWNDHERKFMQVLRASAFQYEQFKDRNPDRHEGTCQWVLQHEYFRDWKISRSSRLLWISADPGCGKSVLAKALIDLDLKDTEFRTTCYFFFKDDDSAQKNICTAISALLHQLICRRPMLVKHAMSAFATNGDKLSQSFHTLWDIFEKLVADPDAGEVFCILDALDECEEGGRYQVIKALGKFHENASAGHTPPNLKICVTSRPYADIERRFTGLTAKFPEIRLRGEWKHHTISREIDQVIKYRVSQLGAELKLNDSERSNLENELLSRTNRTYLWVTLIFDVIREMNYPTSRKLKAAVSDLPSTVDEVYEAILARVKENDRRQAQKLLHIIVGAIRPLTIQEMNIALAIEDHHRSYKDLEHDLDDEARFVGSVRHLCGLFVTVVDQRVYLIHQTAKEFLVGKNGVTSDKWKHSLILEEADLLMARICIVYLSFTEFDKEPGPKPAAVERSFLEYASVYWADHYRISQHSASDKLLQNVFRICNPHSATFQTWTRVHERVLGYMRENPTSLETRLAVGAYFRHEVVVQRLLEDHHNVNASDVRGETALLQATRRGYEGIVKLLLDVNANVDLADKNGSTPLIEAAGSGYEGIVKLLLNANASVDLKTHFGRTPLSVAAGSGYEGIVKLLLNAHAEVNSRTNTGETPLSEATRGGYKGIVKLLLEAYADVTSKDIRGCTALIYAAEMGDESIIKFLLESKADINSKDRHWGTPLSWAAKCGHTNIVKLLLEANASLEPDKDGRTPLFWARKNGHKGIAELLEARQNGVTT